MDKLNKEQIRSLLPHREPMLLIDELYNIKKLSSATAMVNVKKNSFFVQGHFPENPVMPGVLILEALAQASGLLVFKTPKLCPPNESLYLFVGIDKARFKRQVIPGDQIILEVIMTKNKQGFAIFSATATVDSEVAASAELMCGFKELPKKL